MPKLGMQPCWGCRYWGAKLWISKPFPKKDQRDFQGIMVEQAIAAAMPEANAPINYLTQKGNMQTI